MCLDFDVISGKCETRDATKYQFHIEWYAINAFRTLNVNVVEALKKKVHHFSLFLSECRFLLRICYSRVQNKKK